MLTNIQSSFANNKVLYTRHAKDEMENEPLGEILDQEVFEAVMEGKLIEQYGNDKPYPSCLIYGQTKTNRPLHVVCAYSESEQQCVVVTVYQPDPEKWIEYERRKK